MLSMHSKTQHFPCDECGKTVEYRKCLKMHMRRHEQPIRPPLHCRAVGVVNCNKKDGDEHDPDEDPDPDPDPDEDETENVDEIDAEFTAPNDESDDVHTQQSNWLGKPPVDSPLQQFTCKDCGNIVTKKGELKRHVSTHDSTKKRKCTICANPLSNTKPLMNHKSCEHEANPSTECEVCGESIDNVRKHTKEIHEGISKPCTICEEAFRISNMKKHL